MSSILHELIVFCANKDNCNKFKDLIGKASVPQEVNHVLAHVEEYLNHTGNQAVVDWIDYDNYLAMRGKSQISSGMLSELKGTSLNPNTLQLFLDRTYAAQLSDKSMEVATGQGKATWDTLADVFDEYARTSVKLSKRLQPSVASSEDVLTMLQTSAATTGLHWALPSWDTLLGKLSTEFMIVAARPDGGKTTFLAQSAVCFAQQLAKVGKQVLWFNNEEAISKVRQRVICSALNLPITDVLANPLQSASDYTKIVPKDSIIYIDDCNHISVIEKAIESYDPGIIIIDQLYKVAGTPGSVDMMEAERFRTLCNWARDIGKHVAPVIVTNQLDGNAEGIMWPTQSMLYGSKTGAQGEADIILTIGRLPTSDNRYFHTPKNKNTSSSDKIELGLNKFNARYYELF